MSGQVITIAQQKGGSGKTTVAANLAAAFLSKGKSVALLDTDPQGSLGKWFMKRVEKLGENPNLKLTTATAWGIAYELRSLRKVADIIIVDTPPKADGDLRPALREADLILVPLSASHVDLWATQDVLDMADREIKDAHIVMNRTRSGTRLGAEVANAVQEFDAKLLKSTLGNRILYAEALGQGLGVVEAKKNSVAALEVMALADEVTSLLDINWQARAKVLEMRPDVPQKTSKHYDLAAALRVNKSPFIGESLKPNNLDSANWIRRCCWAKLATEDVSLNQRLRQIYGPRHYRLVPMG